MTLDSVIACLWTSDCIFKGALMLLLQAGYVVKFFDRCITFSILLYKGQLISKANSKLFIWTKKPTKFFFCISELASKSGQIKKISDKYMTNSNKLFF